MEKRRNKRALSAVLVLLMVLALLPAAGVTARAADDVWDGTVSSTLRSAGDTYYIDSAADLAYVAQLVNDETKDFSGKTLLLTKDIDLGSREWTPIGNTYYICFRGTFDGQGHTIRNLCITGTLTYNGLFGAVEGATLKNVGIVDAYIAVSSGGSNGALAGIVRLNAGQEMRIENCYSTGSVSSKFISGGLVGFFGNPVSDNNTTGRIENCYSACAVSGIYSGGLVGRLYLQEGGNTAAITNCYAAGNVTGGSGLYAGGLIGDIYVGSGAQATVSGCLALGESVKGPSSNTNRIVGGARNYGTLTLDNYAYRGMLVNNAARSSADAASEDGANLSAYKIWNDLEEMLTGWDFNDVWEYSPGSGSLPTLRGINAAQEAAIPYNYLEYFSYGDPDTVLLESIDLDSGTVLPYTVKTGADFGVELREIDGTKYWLNAVNGSFVAEGSAITALGENYALYVSAAAVTFETNGGSAVDIQTVGLGDKAVRPTDPSRAGYTFAGWYSDSGLTVPYDFEAPVTGDITLYAKWESDPTPRPTPTPTPNPGPVPAARTHTLTFETNGGTPIAGKSLVNEVTVSLSSYVTSREGYTFAGWYSDSALTKPVTRVTMTKNTTVYAKWTENAQPSEPEQPEEAAEETYSQRAYITGFDDGTVRPDANITRGEVAQILYNISGSDGEAGAVFDDVSHGAWYYGAVTALAGSGVIAGYDDGTFRPAADITRGEFAALVVRWAGLTPGGAADFSDVPGDSWAAGYIAAAQAAGYVSGYSDGTFQPEQPITRAEAISIINRVLGIACDGDSVANVRGQLKIFSDNTDSGKWCYYDILAATNSFTYAVDADGNQTWVRVD